MARWHNGRNGPGVCRAKQGNCPFGGDESHFDSKVEAEKIYNQNNEQEFGILPGVNKESSESKEDTRETKVYAYNSHGVALANSNFVKSTGKGTKYENEYINNKLKESNMDAKKMVDSLNNDANINGKWAVKEESDDKVKLENKDVFGNISYMEVKKIEPEVKVSKPGEISSYGARNNMPQSLSNYVSTGPGGSKEAQEYFANKISKAELDSGKMVRFLNADKRIHGKWSLASEDENSIKLENEDAFGNLNYVSVTKK